MPWHMQMYQERFNTKLNELKPEILKKFKIWCEDPNELASPLGVRFWATYSNDYISKSAHIVMQPYSACCAFEQLNFFSYGGAISEEEVHAFIDLCNQMMRTMYKGSWAKRLVLNTVQIPTIRYGFKSSPEELAKDTGSFQYPFVQSWVKKHKDILDTPVVNHNTANIIHHLIVSNAGV